MRGSTARLVLGVGLVAGLVVWAAVTAALAARRAADERWALARLDRRLAHAALALERYGDEVDAALASLEPLPPAAEDAGGAAALARGLALDLLAIVDSAGRVVSSYPWPERAGLPAPELLATPLGPPSVTHVRSAGGSRLGIAGRGERRRGGGVLWVVGGRLLDERFLEEAAAGDPAVLWDFGDESSTPVASASPGDLDPDGVAAFARSAAPSPVRARGRAGREWWLGRHGFSGPAGEPVGALVVGAEIPPGGPSWGGRRAVAAAAGALAALGAAAVGFWLAARVRRPLARLVRAVDAIAAGIADYSFPQEPGDDLGALGASFSRLARSLDLERERTRAAERVAAWREVARRVAHEVKNPLVPIRLTVENLERVRRTDLRKFDEMFEDGARTILEEVGQLTRLVGEFSEFARLPAPVPERVDLEQVVDGVVELFGAEPAIDLVRTRAGGAIAMALDPAQIARALKNIVGNAVEAVREMDAPRRRVEIHTSVSSEICEVRVADRGPGFPEAATARLFEPYFTTKRDGTGLGMAIAARIVAEHGGWVAVRNRAGGGAEVVIRLPRHGPRPAGRGGRA